MNNIPHHKSTVNPEEVASAINAAFAEFLAVEPTTTSTLLLHRQEHVDPLPLTTEILSSDDDLSRNSRPPTPYAVSTHTHSGEIFCFFFVRFCLY
jgi:hypothetical protein